MNALPNVLMRYVVKGLTRAIECMAGKRKRLRFPIHLEVALDLSRELAEAERHDPSQELREREAEIDRLGAEVARLGAKNQRLSEALPGECVFPVVDRDDRERLHLVSGSRTAIDSLEHTLRERFADGVALGKAGVEEVRDAAAALRVEADRIHADRVRLADELRPLRVGVEELRHRANGWADIATSGLQWLRNVRDGFSTPQTAIENIEALIADLREGRWRDPAIRAEDLVEALSDEPAAPQGEVQP